MQRCPPILSLLLVALGLAQDLAAQSRLRDPEDGRFDISWYLQNSSLPIVPVPVPITEPSLDYGLALGLVYFWGREPGDRTPPSLSAAAGMYTGNGSWGAALAHVGHWKNDGIRYTGALAYGSVNLTWYGQDGAGQPIDYTLESLPLFQQLRFRVSNDLYLGARYLYTHTDIRLDEPVDAPGGQTDGVTRSTGGLGAIVSWDSRDNTFTPGRGVLADATYMWFDPAFGGDFVYRQTQLKAIGWIPLGSRFVGGLRFVLESMDGDAPFYVLPFVDLRGVPSRRYQGATAITAELQGRWNVAGRWSLVGFGGAGGTGDDLSDVTLRDQGWNVGLGGRYLIARAFGLQVGMDVARGPEQWAFYVVFGSSWR